MEALTGTVVPTWVMVLVTGVLTLSLFLGVPLARLAGKRRGRRLAHPELYLTKKEKAKDTALFLAALVPSVLVWLAVMGVSFLGLTGFAADVMSWTHWTNMLVPLSLDGISVSFGAWAFVAVKRGRHPGRAYKIVLAAAMMSALLNFVHGRSEWSIWAGLYLAFLSFAGMAMFHELLDQFMAAYDDEVALKSRYPRFGQRWFYAPFSTFAARRAWIVDPPREALRPTVRNALEHLENMREDRRRRRLGGSYLVREEQQAKLVEIHARNEVKAARRGQGETSGTPLWPGDFPALEQSASRGHNDYPDWPDNPTSPSHSNGPAQPNGPGQLSRPGHLDGQGRPGGPGQPNGAGQANVPGQASRAGSLDMAARSNPAASANHTEAAATLVEAAGLRSGKPAVTDNAPMLEMPTAGGQKPGVSDKPQVKKPVKPELPAAEVDLVFDRLRKELAPELEPELAPAEEAEPKRKSTAAKAAQKAAAEAAELEVAAEEPVKNHPLPEQMRREQRIDYDPIPLFSGRDERPMLPGRVRSVLDTYVRRGDDLSATGLTTLVLRALGAPANRDDVSRLVLTWTDEIHQGARVLGTGKAPKLSAPQKGARSLEYPFELLALQPVTVGSNVVSCPDCGTAQSLQFSGLHSRRPVEARCGCGRRWPIVGLGSSRVWEVLADELASGQAQLITE